MTEKAYHYILERINKLELNSGQKINVVRLAETLEMSRTPVKKALEILADEGHVVRIDGSFRVPPIDPLDFMHLIEARQMIESTAAYMAASQITKDELNELKQTILEAKAARSCGDMELFSKWDNLFHEKIVTASRNTYIISMYRVLIPRIHRYHGALKSLREQNKESDSAHACEKHIAIYAALKSRYSSLARAEMEEHLRFTNQYLVGMIKNVNR
ncbi:MAG: GntR family transcriptional regulator [Oscillospiraceae bacterium]